MKHSGDFHWLKVPALALLVLLGVPATSEAEEGDPEACASILLATLKEAVPAEKFNELINGIAAGSGIPVDELIKRIGGGDSAHGAWTGRAKIAKGAAAARFLVDSIYSNLIAYGVYADFTTPDDQRAHYGPREHEAVLGEPGAPVRFTLRVIFKVDIGPAARSCRELAGYKVPKKGPISDVPVMWSKELGTTRMEYYGTLTYDPANMKTGEDGTSTMIFRPFSELDWRGYGLGQDFGQNGIAGIGKEVDVAGSLLADPLVLTALSEGGIVLNPAFLSQYFWASQTSWSVAFHQARGFKFPEVHFQTRRELDAFQTDRYISGHICGTSPWSTWTIDTRWQTSWRGVDYQGRWRSFEQKMNFSENGSTLDTGSGGKIAFLIQPRFPPKMVIEMTALSGYPLTTPATVTVPITEDPSCPGSED